MTSRSDQPAFPAMHFDLGDGEHGMTLRDYFAAKALEVACRNYSAFEAAVLSYEYADAMLKVRDAKA